MATLYMSRALTLFVQGPQKLAVYGPGTTLIYRVASLFNIGRDVDANTLLEIVRIDSEFGIKLKECCIAYLLSNCDNIGSFSLLKGRLLSYQTPKTELHRTAWGYLRKWLSVAELCIQFKFFIRSARALCSPNSHYGDVHGSVMEEAKRQYGSVVINEYLSWLCSLQLALAQHLPLPEISEEPILMAEASAPVPCKRCADRDEFENAAKRARPQDDDDDNGEDVVIVAAAASSSSAPELIDDS